MVKRRLLSALLSIVMVLSVGTTVLAAGDEVASQSGTGATSDITVTSEVPVFSVTVPTALTANVNNQGVVTVADPDVTLITNASYAPVYVSNIEATALAGWDIIEYDADYDIANAKPGDKKIGFKINNVTSKEDDSLAGWAAADWSMTGVGDTTGNFIELDYDVKLPVQYDQLDNDVLVQVVFTVAWDTVNF